MWQYNPFAAPLILSIVPLAAFFYSAWPRRADLTVRLFLVFVACIIGVTTAYIFELSSATLAGMMFWIRIEYLFLPIPVVFLLLVFCYIGRDEWITPRRIALLMAIPVIQMIAAWTNASHLLNWTSASVQYLGDVALFDRTYGPIFYLGMIYIFGVTVAACTLLMAAMLRAPAPQRSQLWPLLLVALFPLAGQALTVLRLTPSPGLDLTPFGFCISTLPMGWGLFRQRLFEIVPTAHDMVIKSMCDAVLVLDERERVVDANPAAERALRMTAAAMIGQPISRLLPNMPVLNAATSLTARGEVTLEYDGETYTYDAQVSPMRTWHNRPRGQVVVLRDITELKQAERTIQQTMETLERRNAELDAFSHTVAHDLRSPISVVAGYVDLIFQEDGDALNPETKRYLTHVRTSAAKMNDIVKNLLLLASLRDTSGFVTDVDITQVARAAVERLEDKIEQRGVRVELDESLPAVTGQAAWLEEVFTNLLDNAVKYIGRNNPAPCILMRGCVINGLARVEIRDNGIGIAPEHLEMVFEMFSRARPAEADGAGLGLSIVRSIIQRLNGEVGVESTPGMGSTFWITLPAARGDAPLDVPGTLQRIF